MTIVPVDTERWRIAIDGIWMPCSIGHAGAIAASAKREGDGATPLGDWPLRGALLRPGGGFDPPPRLPWRWLRPDDGWSDDPRDGAYNLPVRHPHRYSAEHLWRSDSLYDVVVWLGYNDAAPQADAGSAIFLHLAQPQFAATEGCVAISAATMTALLREAEIGDLLSIR